MQEVQSHLPLIVTPSDNPPSSNNGRCPYCGGAVYKILPWKPPGGFDLDMIQVKCACGEVSYIGPKPKTTRRIYRARRS